ncbi:hypothetical protein ZOSMA_30G00250 [Zostera marina]|uniref:Uncharacterized protein n=1 Tax=Zostera marina TaxID=29655 RepID=A0A0K9P9V2_ZOSMR|nr:hypothetical protein ZOSMA_30G00250 [Zostera marina]
MAAMFALGRKEKKRIETGENDIEIIRQRCLAMEKELKESKEREEAMRNELMKTRQRLRVAEDAEERLCSQLGDLEAESVDQARLYYLQVKTLQEQLDRWSPSQSQTAAVLLRG